MTHRSSLWPHRRLFLCWLLALLISCTGCKQAQLSVSGPVEYSLSPVDASEVIVCDDEDAKLQIKTDIVGSRVGTQTISVQIGEGLFTRTESIDVQVVDSQAPMVSLDREHVEVEMGAAYDPHDEILEVSDPIDGLLEEVEEIPSTSGTAPGIERYYDTGWYLLDGELDLDVPGTYPLDVFACDQHGNETHTPLEVEVIDPLAGVKLQRTTDTLEYATGSVDPTTLVTCSIDDAKLESEELSLAEVGLQKVRFTITKGASTKRRTRTFRVLDSQPPSITLAKNTVRVEMGASFDPLKNVSDVVDPVDGALDAVAKRPEARKKGLSTKAGQRTFYEKGWYLVRGSYDLSKQGSYVLTVIARDRHGNKAEKSYTLRVVDPLAQAKLNKTTKVLEYAQQDIDPVKLVKCSVEDATVKANPLSLRTLGKAVVTYTVTKGGSTHTYKRTFQVRDTKSPTITLGSSSIDVANGESFDKFANVSSVSDPVDGQLSRVDSEPTSNGNGWYTVTGSVDTSRAGRYDLTVIACDRNGNRTSKEYSVSVAATAPLDTGRDYVLNTNTYKFHYPGCRDVSKIAPYNRWDVHMTREEVISRGYSSCGHCHP